MTNIEQDQAIIRSENAQYWYCSVIREKRRNYFRSQAIIGLRAAIDLALGCQHDVKIIQGRRLRDVSISIDCRIVPASFYFGN